VGWVYGAYGEQTYARFSWEDQLEDLNADGRTILKLIFKRMKGRVLDSSGQGQGQVAGSATRGNAPSRCTKCQVFNYVGNCAIPKRLSYSCNELSWLEMGTFQDTRGTEFEGMTSNLRKSRTPKQGMLDRESPRTHG
jgi:hypothetical protein